VSEEQEARQEKKVRFDSAAEEQEHMLDQFLT